MSRNRRRTQRKPQRARKHTEMVDVYKAFPYLIQGAVGHERLGGCPRGSTRCEGEYEEGEYEVRYIDPPRVRAWILEEQYIEGLRNNTDEHGAALLTDESMERSIFGLLEEVESIAF